MNERAFDVLAVKGVYEHAASLVNEGRSKRQVREGLKSRGLNDEGAAVVTDSVFELRTNAVKESGQLNILYGALLCVAGVVAVVISYMMAEGPFGVRHYAIALGAIVFGAVEFFLGLAQKAGHGRAFFITGHMI
jgi:hypothetical protein